MTEYSPLKAGEDSRIFPSLKKKIGRIINTDSKLSEQIMFTDKYQSIFLRQMEAFVYISIP